jgi:branched-chain amino acid transport system substrate-binding protein
MMRRPRRGGGDRRAVTSAEGRRDRPGETPGRSAAPGTIGPPAARFLTRSAQSGSRTAEPPPDDALHSYIRAFAGSGWESASFLWHTDRSVWFSIRLNATPAGDIRVGAEQVTLPHRLTARELDVLTLLAIGLSNTEIGAVLVSSPRTISTHVEHILAKLGQTSRTGAAGVAVERGYLRLPLPGMPLAGLQLAGSTLPGRGSAHGSLAICAMHERVVAETGEGAGNPGSGKPGSGNPGSGRPGSGNGARQVRAGRSAPARRMPGERTLRIGSAFPLAGLAGDDGHQMVNGSALAIGQLNARGGIGGRLIEQIVVDVDVFSPDGVAKAFRQLFEADVDAVTSGYVFPEDVAAGLAAQYGAPYLHAMTSQSQAQTVRDNQAAFRNVFQVCPTEVHYGPGFVRFLDSELDRGWRPRSRRVAFVDTDLPSGQLLNARTVSAAEQSGWQISGARTVAAIGADWAALARDLERLEPAAVMIAQFLPGELAAFQRDAAARLPGTLIYAIYAPSVPEFLKIAGPDAEGTVWATVTGTYDDSIGQRFRADYADAFGELPGWSHAGIAYDEIHLLARAWMSVRQPRDFAAVSRELRQVRYRGVNGSYFLDNAEQSGLGFPDTTRDPSLGQAHLVLQVQDGSHRIISPAPYAESRFREPVLAAGRTLPAGHGRAAAAAVIARGTDY